MTGYTPGGSVPYRVPWLYLQNRQGRASGWQRHFLNWMPAVADAVRPASLTAQSSAGASGYVTVPASIMVGGMPIKSAGTGVTVDMVAVRH